jgi:hypothetical protein
MSNRFDVCTPRPKKDGGSWWLKVGTAWQNEKGVQVILDAYPAPDAEGRIVLNLFEPRDDKQRSAQNDRQQARGNGGPQNKYTDDSDGVPFVTSASIW